MVIHSLGVALEATLDYPEAAVHAMSVVLTLPLVTDVIVCEVDFPATLRRQFLSFLVVLELAQA